MLDLLLDVLLDTIKLLPFLYLAFFIVEFCEHKASDRFKSGLVKYNKAGPVIGALLGTIPQCGFCVASVELFSGGIITFGTMLAVIIATSDEALPILIAGGADAASIIEMLVIKFVLAIIAGFAFDLLLHDKRDIDEAHHDMHSDCEDHCCEHGPALTALEHTWKSAVIIFITMLIFDVLIEFFGEQIFASGNTHGFIFSMLAALIGFIPGCAPSILLSELFISGVLDMGGLLAGLITNSGVAIVTLLRAKHETKEKILTISTLLVLALICAAVL